MATFDSRNSSFGLRTATSTAALLMVMGAYADTAPSPGATVIRSFESAADIAAPGFYASLAKVSLTSEGATDGSSALAVSVPASGAGTYPAISLYPATAVNLSTSGGLAFDVTNTSSSSITFTLKLKDAKGATMERPATLPAGASATYRLGSEMNVNPATYGVKALPNPFKSMISLQAWTTGSFDLTRVAMIQIYVRSPLTTMSYTVDNFRLLPAFSMTSYLTGVVDQFGQNSKELWPNKITSASQFGPRDAAEQIDLEQNKVPGRNEYGGYQSGPTLPATGHFRTEKVGGRWWLVDPNGKLFFSTGINNIDPEAPTVTTNREWMMPTAEATPDSKSKIKSFSGRATSTFDYYAQNLSTKYGRSYEGSWAANADRRLKSWGFNTVGNWSNRSLIQNGTSPYVLDAGTSVGSHHTISTGLDYWGKLPDPFDSQFATDAALGVSKAAWLARNSARCIGYMVDNELSWVGVGTNADYGIAYGTMREAVGASPAKRALLSQLQSKYGTVSKLNAAWGTSYSTWTSLQPALELPSAPNSNQKADMDAFVLSFARKYFAVVRNAVKTAAPDALYLGCRFSWYTNSVLRAADEYCDVISFNHYADKFDPAKFTFAGIVTKPCMVSEFSYGATDRGLPYAGLVQSASQTARAAAMQDYVRSVASMPNFVGAHWFQYADEPLLGRPLDGSNGNIGMVDVSDTPYPEMVAAARKVNSQVYDIHGKS